MFRQPLYTHAPWGCIVRAVPKRARGHGKKRGRMNDESPVDTFLDFFERIYTSTRTPHGVGASYVQVCKRNRIGRRSKHVVARVWVGPVAMSAPPVVSATFFPQNQRTMATSIISISNYLGACVCACVRVLVRVRVRVRVHVSWKVPQWQGRALASRARLPTTNVCVRSLAAWVLQAWPRPSLSGRSSSRTSPTTRSTRRSPPTSHTPATTSSRRTVQQSTP